jgi:hypothetical protein
MPSNALELDRRKSLQEQANAVWRQRQDEVIRCGEALAEMPATEIL